jgi:hypothetical protein
VLIDIDNLLLPLYFNCNGNQLLLKVAAVMSCNRDSTSHILSLGRQHLMEQGDWSGTCKVLSDDTVSAVPTETAIINKHEGQNGTDRQAVADIGKDLRKLGVINQKHKLKGAWTPG